MNGHGIVFSFGNNDFSGLGGDRMKAKETPPPTGWIQLLPSLLRDGSDLDASRDKVLFLGGGGGRRGCSFGFVSFLDGLVAGRGSGDGSLGLLSRCGGGGRSIDTFQRGTLLAAAAAAAAIVARWGGTTTTPQDVLLAFPFRFLKDPWKGNAFGLDVSLFRSWKGIHGLADTVFAQGGSIQSTNVD